MCPIPKPQWFTLKIYKPQWTLSPSRELLWWVGCQFLVNSWNNCRFKTISANAFIRSGQKFYYSQSLLSPSWKNFQPFCKKLAADSKYWLPTSASSKGLHTPKPNQNKAKPWSIDDPMRYGCTRATLVLHVSFSVTQTSSLLCQSSSPCLHFTQFFMWWQITEWLHRVCGRWGLFNQNAEGSWGTGWS